MRCHRHLPEPHADAPAAVFLFPMRKEPSSPPGVPSWWETLLHDPRTYGTHTAPCAQLLSTVPPSVAEGRDLNGEEWSLYLEPEDAPSSDYDSFK